MIFQDFHVRHIIFIFLIFFVFYLGIPGIGAVVSRARWRRFRSTLERSVGFPIPSYGVMRDKADTPLGQFRMFGTLQAIQDEEIIWILRNDLSVRVEMDNVDIYMLPAMPGRGVDKRESFPDETPKIIPWDRVFALPEGTKMYVAGTLYSRDGGGVFSSKDSEPLMVVVYDCSDESFYRHAVWCGRQRNEYWNQFTPASLTIGSFALFIYFYVLLRIPYMRAPAIIALSLSFLPISPLFPPGLGLYYIYRYLWKRGRILRAERDLLRLEAVFPGEISAEYVKPEQEAESLPVFGKQDLACEKRAVRLELISLATLSIGFGLNLFLVFILLRHLIR